MEYLFLISLFLVAFLYSSVGHGGGSGYLAIMAIFGMAPEFMKSTSLTLNVFVSLIAFITYFRAGYFRPRIVIPFLIASIPMSYIGARIHVNPMMYKIVLGVFLFVAIIRLLFIPKSIAVESKNPPIILAIAIGAVLGFLSGMIGIGGGIILSPLLIIFHWANMKEAAAASSLFIFLNSVAGLFGIYYSGFNVDSNIVLLIIVGVVGGVAGSYSGSFKLKAEKLKYLLVVVLLIACVKLFVY